MTKEIKKTGIEHLENVQINWFPGHMNKAQKEIKKNIKLVNIIIEVRDARLPLISGNKESYSEFSDKPRLILLNKTNLTTNHSINLWKEWFKRNKQEALFINILEKNSLKTIITKIKNILKKHHQKTNAKPNANKELKIMILGLPNTGKSTLINQLAKRNATKAASTPGQTKQNLWVKVSDGLSLLDTPGVMPHKIKKPIHGLYLSLIHAIPDNIIDPQDSVNELVKILLQNKSEVFLSHYKLNLIDFNLDQQSIIEEIGQKRGALKAGGLLDYNQIYNLILKDFRDGKLGKISFETPK